MDLSLFSSVILGTTSDFLGRFYHCAQLVSEGTVVIFGGQNEDHSCCLYIEIAQLPAPNIRSIETNCQEIILPQQHALKADRWLRQIYLGEGPTDVNVSAAKDWAGLLSTPEECQSKMSQFIQNGNFSDISIKTKSDQIVPAHKVLLYANCTLFETLLNEDLSGAEKAMPGDLPGNEKASTTPSSNNKPQEKIVVPLDRVDTCDFRLLQSFLYGLDDIILDESNAVQILQISNQCLVTGLEEQVLDYIFLNSHLFDPFEMYGIGQRMGLKNMEIFFRWYLKMNYRELCMGNNMVRWEGLGGQVRKEIEEEWWPGEAYVQARAKWQVEYDSVQKKQTKEKCFIQ